MWQLEEDYWRYVSTGDVDAYVKLWHDDFVGWPCFEWKPARKGDIGKWVREIRDNKWKLTYQLKPLEMQEFGRRHGSSCTMPPNTCTTTATARRAASTSGAKFTHTWMKSGDSWQIIGGMCAAQEPVKAPRG